MNLFRITQIQQVIDAFVCEAKDEENASAICRSAASDDERWMWGGYHELVAEYVERVQNDDAARKAGEDRR